MVDHKVIGVDRQKAVAVGLAKRDAAILKQAVNAEKHGDHGEPLQKADLRQDQGKSGQESAQKHQQKRSSLLGYRHVPSLPS